MCLILSEGAHGGNMSLGAGVICSGALGSCELLLVLELGNTSNKALRLLQQHTVAIIASII